MFRKALFLIMTLFLILNAGISYGATANTSSYTTLGVVDKNTFNEYKYKITAQYIDLRNKFEVNGKIDSIISGRILTLAESGYKYLPDDLINKNYFSSLKSAIEKGQKYPENSSYFQDIASSIEDYLEKTTIQSVKGNIDAYPSSGNAPLSVSLRANITDPTGTKLENYNYTWWMNIGGKRVVIGNGVALYYVFKEEGNYTVFLDVTSNHKNSSGYPDVLPFSSRVDIEVKEKIASLILKINNKTLGNQEEIKFSPDEGKYGILFDATSSTPTSGARFTRTEWDFGNGVKRSYDGSPQIERVVYASEGDYNVKLSLRTNEGKVVDRKFIIRIHQPIATIYTSSEEGYMGDKFTFTANPNSNQTNLSYAWRIIDINNDVEMVAKNSSTFTYTFKNKGKYNVQLFVTEPNGDVDYDSKIIYINSRAPEARFTFNTPNQNKPNTIFLDATSSYDPDYSDNGKLEFNWEINGQRVNLNNPNYNGSNGYYTFSSLGDQSVTLEVTDPDNMSSIISQKINIRSILSLDFNAFPRVSQIGKNIRFIADSPKAQYFEWDFGDGTVMGETKDTITHVYKRSGVFGVRLRVVDENDNENIFTKNVFIGDAEYPYPFITLKDSFNNEITYSKGECGGEGAYIVNRVDSYTFSGDESLDISGEKYGVTYSWRLGNSIYSSQSFQKKFDELGCFKAKLTVTSTKNGKSASQDVNVKVENLKPTLGSLDIRPKDINADPVVITVTAQGAKDLDGVIQSYLWYYYTDLDPEPQDFRSTRVDSTTFVIPKITGNYYFAVVMKDNNEVRVNSEDINNSRYFITLTGDNVNTPLVNLSINNSSVYIGDEVTFVANVENILGQSLNNLATFSWDFDGDGFYDMETNTNSVTHKYKSSGEMFAKVRVKYRGFSNTKTVTINVANILKPDFDYVSIGSTFIFFDNSLSNGATYDWDMGDGNTVSGKTSFVYKYTDDKTSHDVTLKLTEGTKLKETKKRVLRNMSNFLISNKSELTIFSNFPIENNTITLENNLKEVYLYPSTNRNDVKYYVADFNINNDSDLNGGNDDDEDNKFQESYTSKGPILIDLDNTKKQIVRVYLKDEMQKIIVSKDITIDKKYIDENIDLDTIVFEGVSDSTKLKLENIKQLVGKFPQEYKLQGMQFVQKLQEEWNDDREKTNIIIEFESFIVSSNITGGNDLIDLLESLLIEGENDRSEKAIAYTALKNLIPKNIQCVGESLEALDPSGSCYNLLISRLDIILGNANIDENKVIGLSILENIADDQTMTIKEKIDFKAILNTFIYGSVANIPEENKEDIIKNEPKEKSDSFFINILVGIGKFLLVIIGIIGTIILLFFVYYKITNKDKNIGFTDFIAIKTGGKKILNDDDGNFEDILGKPLIPDNKEEENKKIKTQNEFDDDYDSDNTLDEYKSTIKDNEVPDWLKGKLEENTSNEEDSTNISEQNKQEIEPIDNSSIDNNNDTDIPDWLKGNFEENNNNGEKITQISEQNKQEIEPIDNSSTDNNDTDVPDWLKGSFKGEYEDNKNLKNIENDTNEPKQDNSINDNEDTEISDGLKQSKNDSEKELYEGEDSLNENKNDIKNEEPKLNTREELDEFTKLEPDNEEDNDIPDWLKGSFDNEVTNQTDNKEGDSGEKEKTESPIKKINEEIEEKSDNEQNKTEKEENVSKSNNLVKSKDDLETNKTKKTIKNRPNKKEQTREKPKVEVKKKVKEEEKVEKKVEEKEQNEKTLNKDNSSDNQLLNIPDTDELWDDGMKIPDWLKTDDEKKES